MCQGFMVSNGQTVTCDADDDANTNLNNKVSVETLLKVEAAVQLLLQQQQTR